MVLYPQYSQLC